MRIRVGILALALAGLAGCGSFTSRFNGHGDEYYSGTQYSLIRLEKVLRFTMPTFHCLFSLIR